MSDIVISNTYFYKLDPKQWKIKTPYPPLGTIYAASFLRENGYNIVLFDTNLISNPSKVKACLETHQPKIFVLYDDGFNYLTKMCLTNMREAIFEMIRIAKKLKCLVIVCSSDSTDHNEKYLNIGADFIIQGEGEATLKELIDTIEIEEDFSKIQGIVFKKGEEIIKNPKRAVLRDLDELPLPAWDLIDIDSYKKVWKLKNKVFSLNIATTRGCPYKCNWCAKPIYGNRYNSHSPEYITKHIKHLKETYNVSRFWMCDDIFGLKPNWVKQFNQELKKEKLKISYYIQSRVDLLLLENNIEDLSESGLEEVWVGAESGSQKILDAMDKGTTVDQIYEATRLLKEKKVRVAFFIQYGYLGETKEDIFETVKMIKELLPENLGISVSYPLPGTKFYEKVKDDLKLKANWTDSDDLSMMFKGPFNSKYYKKLYQYTHKEYRKSQGIAVFKKILKNPFSITKYQLRSMVLFGYYLTTAFFSKIQLDNMKQTNA